MSSESVLIVDDDTALRELIANFLREHDYVVREAADVPAMRSAMAASRPDLIILDLMMPGEDGLAALRTLDGRSRPPVIMLSAMSSDVDRIVGLEMGADDYVPKPCNPRELLARVRAVLRRSQPDPQTGAIFRLDGWTVNTSARELLSPHGEPVSLTANEFRLLEILVRAGRRVLSRDELMQRLKGEDFEEFDRSIDLAISRLRRKIADAGGGEIIRTVRGEGYGIVPHIDRE